MVFETFGAVVVELLTKYYPLVAGSDCGKIFPKMVNVLLLLPVIYIFKQTQYGQYSLQESQNIEN